MEPNYVGNNGRIDAIAAAWLLDEDHVFFLDNEITWDGKNHGFTGAQVNAGNMDEVPVFMSNYEVLLNGVLDLMMTLEKDKGLRVPRDAVHQSLHEAIRAGDLTGITLFNLIACGHAIKVLRNSEDSYQVIYDNRLARGIPSFYQLTARMIWDMRGYNDITAPFQVMFASARNIDADQYLRDFNGVVPGAVSETMWVEQVSSEPYVELPSQIEISSYIEESSAAFASGFDAPDEMQADEELFETSLAAVAREFPKSIAIEGTHVLGRANRIESIKVGDPIILAADWQSQYFNPVCIEVFNSKGESLGNLNEQFTPAMSGNRELACLLPYITATVESVTPLSQRRKGSKYALMDVHMEIDPNIFVDGLWAPNLALSVIKKAKELLALPPAARVVLSKGDLVASDLDGSVSTARATDIPNPLGSVYKKLDDDDSAIQQNITDEDGEEEIDERQAMISLLRVLVLAGELGGNVTFPPDLLEELERAENGDETVDVEDLAERINGVMPANEVADLTSVTFEQGTTAEGRRFSVAVPDGWTAVENYEESTFLGTTTRPFVIVQGEADGASNLQNRDRIIYSDMGGDVEVAETYAECGIADLKWALAMMAKYDKSDTSGLMGMRPNVVWDEEVQAVNTRCFVSQSQANEGANGLEVYVNPYALDHNDALRFVFTYEGEQCVEPVRDLAKAIARTVRLDKPIVPTCEKSLEKALAGKVDVDEFVEMVGSFVKPYVGLRQSVFTSHQYKYATNTESFDEDECTLAGARGIAEFNSRAALVLDRLMDAYDVQVASGATISDLDKMLEALSFFGENAIATANIFEDYDAKKIKAAGIFNETEEIAAPKGRLAYAKEHGGMPSIPSGAKSAGGFNGVVYNAPKKEEPQKQTIEEPFSTPAIPRIEKALNEKVSSSYFIETSEIAANALMAARQSACDAAISSWNSDEDNVVAMAKEFAKFNTIICRYYGHFVDALEAQVALGNTPGEIKKMAAEVNEFSELVADRFSCGNTYLDSVANSRSPVGRPAEYADIRARWQKVNAQ